MDLSSDCCCLTLDQAKCFDRLHLDNLLQIVRHLDIDALETALSIYGTLERHMFVLGHPSEFILKGSGIPGAPQGCPMACIL